MSGFFWNIRGFNKTTKQLVVKDWIKYGNLKFGCLIETKVKEEKAGQIVSSVFKDWSYVANYEFSRRGRIWVLWDKSVKLVVLSKSAQAITCVVHVDGVEEDFCCSVVYASNFIEERKLLWEELQKHKDDASFAQMPWFCFGDFNEILDIREHSWALGVPNVSMGMSHFQNMVRYCELLDVNAHGPMFTWTNRQDNNLVSKKLDRCLLNEVGFVKFPHAYCMFGSGGCSDHLRGKICFAQETRRSKGPFKFANAVATLPEFVPAVKNAWDDTAELFHSTSALFRFAKKLKSLKPVLRALGRSNLANISVRSKDALADLNAKQEAVLSNPTEDNSKAEALALERWERVSRLEERFLKQRSKLHWLKVGDENSKAFYNAITVRQARNAIRVIVDNEGRTLTGVEVIKQEASRYFEEFLNHQPDDFVGMEVDALRDLLEFECSEVDQQNLTKEVSATEIKKTLFRMPKEKAPGPDGFTVEFFKEAWSIVGTDCTIAIQSFFRYGFLPKGLNSTILALIPKKEEAKVMKDYRPISCCNVIYKVISKILANRLKCILPRFIAPNQSAFVRDRLLMENLLLATELVKSYHKEDISARCAMKIDISKAFDSVQWPFLLNTLRAMNVPAQFIKWIDLCISTASFSVQVNGELAGFFQSKRGLRQGCSLSPYLFVICMNVLSKLLDKAAEERRFGYHPGCQQLKITHLCFADDIMVFTDGNARSLEGVLTVFDEFAGISGLRISLAKSTLFLAGVSMDQRNSVLARFPFESGTLPVRYLGLPLLTKRMTVADYTPLLEKIKARISSWTNRFLSFAGRLQLLKSVIASLTNFWIMAFRLPKGCIKEIERICSAFLWSGPELKAKKAKVCWENVCLPKKEGGLGLKRLDEANKVSVLKLIWRILSANNSLWVDWIKRNIIRTGSLWSEAETTNVGSWMWRKIIKYRTIAQSFHRVEVCDGKTTSLWFDNWSPLGCLFDVLGNRGFIDFGLSRKATVAEALASSRRRRFRFEFANQILDELSRLRERGEVSGCDKHLWRSATALFKTEYSTRDTWEQVRVTRVEKDWYAGVWFTQGTPKYSFITWLATLNRLSTGDRMRLWGPTVNTQCVLCRRTMESRDHLFFGCIFTSAIWKKLMLNLLGRDFTVLWSDLLRLLQGNSLAGSKLFICRYVFQCAIHTIWTERNKRRHGEVPISSRQLEISIDRLVRNKLSLLAYPGSKLEDALRLWFGSR